MGRNKAYLSLFFVLNNISLLQKNTFFEGKCVMGTKSGARKLTTFAICLNPASPILIVEGSVYTRNILSFNQQTRLIKSNWLSLIEGVNTLGVASDGCNRIGAYIL